MSSEEQVKQCYEIEDNESGLNCIKKVVREYKGECAPRLVLLTQEGCTHCAEEKTRHQSDIESGTISVIDVQSKDGREIIEINELDSVPVLLLLDCHSRLIE